MCVTKRHKTFADVDWSFCVACISSHCSKCCYDLSVVSLNLFFFHHLADSSNDSMIAIVDLLKNANRGVHALHMSLCII